MPKEGKKSARKAPVSASRSQATNEWMRGMRLNTYTITLLAMIVLGVLTLAPRVQEWFVLRQQVAQAQADVAKARAYVKNMQTEVKRWEDPVYIRSQARDRLYYVMPGEVSYLVMDANGVDTSDKSGTVGAMLADQRNYGQISKSIKETRNNWVDSVLQTVIVAGIDEPKATTN
jgi:cell division protein FtsB